MKKVIITFISLLVMIFIFVMFTVNKNDKYNDDMVSYIKKNITSLESINYINKYDNYYIVKDKDNVMVIDNDMNIVLSEKLSNIYSSYDDIVYRLNRLMYVEKIVKDNKVTYNYYDIYSYEEIDSIVVEG